MSRMPYNTCKVACFACVLLVATWAQSVLAAPCRVRYSLATNNMTPLLFGGTYERCVAGCQPRNDPWSDLCNPTNYTRPTACQPSQISTVIQAVRASAAASVASAALELNPCQLNELLRDRTLWLIGDSHMRAFYNSLRCFMMDFWDHKMGECAPTTDKEQLKALFEAADTKLTNLEGNSPITDMPKCLHLLDSGRVCWVHSVRGEEIAAPDPEAPGVMQVLQSKLAMPQDIFWISYGRWHYHNCIGFDRNSYTKSLSQLGLLYQQTRARFPNVFFKTPPHDHTACFGDWANKRPTVCLPAGQGNYPLEIGETLSQAPEEILRSFGMNVMDTYNRSLSMPYAHIRTPKDGTVDCNHWCSPGLHEWDIWNLYRNLYRMERSGTSWPAVRSHVEVPDTEQCLPVTQQKPPASWMFQKKLGFSNVMLG